MNSICMLPLVGCLNASESELGKDRNWNSSSEKQNEFLNIFKDLRKKTKDIPEMKSLASRDYNIINKFLEENGFDIKLSKFESPSFGVAAILNVMVEWMENGNVIEKEDYTAVSLRSGVSFSSYEGNIIVNIKTKSDDELKMMICNNPPQEFDLLNMVQKIEEESVPNYEYKGVIFPMISYDEQIDISWMCGLSTCDDKGKEAFIAEAKQQTKFQMNEIGARVKSAAAMTVSRSCCCQPPYVIDKPFLLWINRPSLGSHSFFVGHFEKEYWKNPGKI